MQADDAPMGLEGENALDSEGFSQEWFDEDFGLTRSRREAEELRRQQLQIEQEVLSSLIFDITHFGQSCFLKNVFGISSD